jgi:hypothetical protein
LDIDMPEQSKQKRPEWLQILKAGVKAQHWVPDAVCVGGTAAALYAGHRMSYDTDHVLTSLRERFDEIREGLETHEEWKTARVTPPVLILGRIEGIEVGFRQLKRTLPVETQIIATPEGPLVVPTLDELLCMKAFLAYNRGVTRDFLDFAALSQCVSEGEVLDSLLKLDKRYAEVQASSVALEVAKALSAAAPFDLNEAELPQYKALDQKWHKWDATCSICHRYGVLLGQALMGLEKK